MIIVPVTSDLFTYVIGATLIALIMAMMHQRGARDRARPVAELWGAPASPDTPPPPPRDADEAGRQVIDHLRQLEARAAPGLAARVMPVFLHDTTTRLTSLRDAVARRDAQTAHRIAHTLHGSAATVGASSMVAVCAEMIREVRCGAFDRCDSLITVLEDDFDSIRRAADANQI
jgi:HPt (histidine-containing phosphotransfer) domain-containing protein